MKNKTSRDKKQTPFVYPKNFIKKNPVLLNTLEQELNAGKDCHFLFTGVPGCGKTYLADLVIRWWRQNGHNPVKLECPTIYREYLRVIDSKASDKHDALRRRINIFCADYAVLDDLGWEKPSTEASKVYLAEIINARYLRLQKGHVRGSIITTNLTINEIKANYGERISDRLQEFFTVATFLNGSFRVQKTRTLRG